MPMSCFSAGKVNFDKDTLDLDMSNFRGTKITSVSESQNQKRPLTLGESLEMDPLLVVGFINVLHLKIWE